MNLQHDILLYHTDLQKPKKLKIPLLKDIPKEGFKNLPPITWIGDIKLQPYKLMLLPTNQGMLIIYRKGEKLKHRLVLPTKHVTCCDFLSQTLFLACIANEILLYNKESDRIQKKFPLFPYDILNIVKYESANNYLVRDTESLRLITLNNG